MSADQEATENPSPQEPAAAETPQATPAATPAVKFTRTQRREKAAGDALRTLIRDLQVDRFGLVPPREKAVDLTLRLRARADLNWELRFDPPLADQVLAQLEDAQAGLATFRQGRVYCFRCESSDCEHSAPRDSMAVFAGYSQTGNPEWQELTQAMLEARHERIDRLFGERPEVVTLVQPGHDLRQKQLSSFGRSSKTYSILGQVVAGYFGLPGQDRASRQPARLALTFQAVETRGAFGVMQLEINPLAALPDGAELDELFASDWGGWVHRAYTLAARDIKQIERRAAAAREEQRPDDLRRHMGMVPSLLNRLAESLERGQRQTRRRTHHVEERRTDHRPVQKAFDDALAAPDEGMFHDEKTGTDIACGEQGRTHVFNAEGRHVTSFLIKPGGVEFRVRTRRWRALTAEEAGAFRQRVREHLAPAPQPRPPSTPAPEPEGKPQA